jgi:hypothetical protein
MKTGWFLSLPIKAGAQQAHLTEDIPIAEMVIAIA